MSTLTKRILSALFLAPLVLGAIYVGGPAYLLLITAGGCLMAYELVNLIHKARYSLQMFLHILAVLFAVLAAGPAGLGIILAGAVVTWFASILLVLRAGPVNRWSLLSIPYLFLPLLALIILRFEAAYGLAALLFVCAITWATDIAAYFAGRAIGGPKLAPSYSPNKTWAGLAGGVGAAIVCGLIAASYLGQTSGVILGALGGVLAVIAQIGDIAESAMKRFFKVKDSGTLIPGHGGILDRVDGLVAVAVAGCALGVIHAGGLDNAATGLMIWRF